MDISTAGLTPLASSAKRELLVWKNAELRKSILTGIAESSAGLGRPNAELDEALDSLDDADADTE